MGFCPLFSVDEGKGERLLQECSRDLGTGDSGMARSLRGLVPRVSCCWWWHEAGGGKIAEASSGKLGALEASLSIQGFVLLAVRNYL